MDAFLVSRPRHAPRSYNHLRGTLVRLFDWLIATTSPFASPVRAHRPRRWTRVRLPFLFDHATARRLLDIAGQLPDQGVAPDPWPDLPSHLHAALRVGPARRGGGAAVHRRRGSRRRDLLVIRQTKFYKSRLVPFGPRIHMLLHGSSRTARAPHERALGRRCRSFLSAADDR